MPALAGSSIKVGSGLTCTGVHADPGVAHSLCPASPTPDYSHMADVAQIRTLVTAETSE